MRKQDSAVTLATKLYRATIKLMLNAVTEVNGIASTLCGGKGRNTSKNSAKGSKNYVTQGRIMFWMLIFVRQVGDIIDLYRCPESENWIVLQK